MPKGLVTITIEDHGCQIATDDLGRLFDTGGPERSRVGIGGVAIVDGSSMGVIVRAERLVNEGPGTRMTIRRAAGPDRESAVRGQEGAR